MCYFCIQLLDLSICVYTFPICELIFRITDMFLVLFLLSYSISIVKIIVSF